MHHFTSDTLTDLQGALRKALPIWSLSPASTITRLHLSENATFRIDDPHTGHRLALRVHRLGYHTPQEIRSELAWIAALRRDDVVQTPAPIATTEGGFVHRLPSPTGLPARVAVAFDFAPGHEPVADADLPEWFGRLGTLTARLHAHARAWAQPEGFRRKAWNPDMMFGQNAHWGPWRAGLGLDPAGIAVMARAIALIRRRLARFGQGPARFGLIHGDLRLANLLIDPPHLRVIDFDDCGFGWHLYDFAAAVSFFEDASIVEALREAWVRGYRAEAPLPQEDVAEIPVFLAMRRFLLVAWIASHPEVPIAQQLGAGYTAGALDMAEALLSRYA